MMEFVFLLSGLILVLSTTQRHMTFTKMRNGNNVVMKTGVLRKCHTSQIFCASMCYRRRECRGFFYNSLTRTCQLQATAYTGYQEVVREKGWKYFKMVALRPLGRKNASTTRKLDHLGSKSTSGPNKSNNLTGFRGMQTSKHGSVKTTIMYRLLSEISTAYTPSNEGSLPTPIPIVSPEAADKTGRANATNGILFLGADTSKRLGEKTTSNCEFSKDLSKSDGFGKEVVESDEFNKALIKPDKFNEEMGKSEKFDKDLNKTDEFDKGVNKPDALKENYESKGRMGTQDELNNDVYASDESNTVIQADSSNWKMDAFSEHVNTNKQEPDVASEIFNNPDNSIEKVGSSKELDESGGRSKELGNIDKSLNELEKTGEGVKELKNSDGKTNSGKNSKVTLTDNPDKRSKKIINSDKSFKELDKTDVSSNESEKTDESSEELDNHDGSSNKLDNPVGIPRELESTNGSKKYSDNPRGSSTGLDNPDRRSQELENPDGTPTKTNNPAINKRLDASENLNEKLDTSSGLTKQSDIRGEGFHTPDVGEQVVIKKLASDTGVENVRGGYNIRHSKSTQTLRDLQRYRIVTMDKEESLGKYLRNQASHVENHEIERFKVTDWCNQHPKHPLCFGITEKRKTMIQSTSVLDSALIPLAVVGVLLPTLLGVVYAARNGLDLINFRRPMAKVKDDLKVNLVEA